MRFSIYLNPQTSGPEKDYDHFRLSVEQALRVTEAGFDGVALTEHHVSGYNTFGDNIMMAAHLAPQVRRGTRFIMAIVVPQMHHPIRLAQQCNLLDMMCRGEVILGMGAGGSPMEFHALGRSTTDRHKEMEESLAVLEKLLQHKPSDPAYRWATKYDRGILSTRIMPTSFSGALRFGRAAQSEESVRWTAQHGWYLLTARAPIDEIAARFKLYASEVDNTDLAKAGKIELKSWSSLARQVVVAQTDAEAEAMARRILERLAAGIRAMWAAPTIEGEKQPTFTKEALGVSPEDPDAFIRGAMIVGSPDTVAKKIAEARTVGVPHLKLCFNFGHMTKEESNRQLGLFLSDVYPRFKEPSSAPVSLVAG